MRLDTSTEFGTRVERRLNEETIIWLTTVRPDGQPLPVPVWFYWDGDTCLIYSQPDKPKLRNIEQNPKVSLNFDSDGLGGDIVRFDGTARVDPDAPLATGVPEMMEKYADGIKRIGTTPEGFAESFSVAIRVSLDRLRGH